VASREYEEMKLEHLRAFGRARHERGPDVCLTVA